MAELVQAPLVVEMGPITGQVAVARVVVAETAGRL